MFAALHSKQTHICAHPPQHRQHRVAVPKRQQAVGKSAKHQQNYQPTQTTYEFINDLADVNSDYERESSEDESGDENAQKLVRLRVPRQGKTHKRRWEDFRRF